MKLIAIYESLFFREQMPQTDGDSIDKLVNAIKKKKVKVKSGQFNVDDLKPSQKDIDWETVSDITEGLDKDGIESMPPIIISDDMYILDGHHRVMAVKCLCPGSMIQAYQLREDVLKAMEIFNQCVQEFTRL